MRSYDDWKSTEPESGYDPPEPSIEEEHDRAVGAYEARLKMLRETAFAIKAERDKYEAALRKIAGWNGYGITDGHENGYALTNYERGANDMLATLKQMAEEALSP